MLENDGRLEHKGYRLGQKVKFRWNRNDYQGVITRLTSSRVVVRFKLGDEITSRYVSYRQLTRPEEEKR